MKKERILILREERERESAEGETTGMNSSMVTGKVWKNVRKMRSRER